jgi:glucose-6-phosphate 1-epimerase
MSACTIQPHSHGLGSLRIQGWRLTAGAHQLFVSAFGGQVLSLRLDGHEMLWASPSPKPLPAPIRAGVPLCWPWFGPATIPGDPQHGWARTGQWTLADQHRTEKFASVALAPEQSFHPLAVRQTVTLHADGRFHQSLETTLSQDAPNPQPLSQALHTYLALEGQSWIEGLPGIDALSVLMPPAPGATIERCFTHADHRAGVDLHIKAHHLSLSLTSADASAVMVWNPGHGAGLVDAPDPESSRFLCVEVGHMREAALTLQPGQSCRLSQTLSRLGPTVSESLE